MVGDKFYRTFPSLFPVPKPYPIDSIFEGNHRTALELRQPYPEFNYTMRTIFGRGGCTVYGYPSTGGIFIKQNVHIVDMNYLSLERLQATPRSSDAMQEDEFCTLMRRIGAIWWRSERDYEVEWSCSNEGYGAYTECNEDKYAREGRLPPTDAQKQVLIFGWPTDGVGVWVLRYEARKDKRRLLPRDFGKINMAMTMDERVEVMKEFCAVFYEKESDVEELGDGFWRENVPQDDVCLW
ncbi:hypothetical protein NHQ30_009315 [Ciborinia camelliae]|nr:hypothetical protein NHQ30_009315 [Ciborinia camelliae]